MIRIIESVYGRSAGGCLARPADLLRFYGLYRKQKGERDMFICKEDYPVADTKYGKVRGFYLDGCFIFQGIKYADAKRFHMPQEPESWEGMKDALSYGYVAQIMKKPVPNNEIMVPHQYWPSSEDCQYLNIWSPSMEKDAKKPVMVWLHGGAFDDGSSIEQVAYEGKNLSMAEDVVVVSVNHRLNILGYWDLSEVDEDYWNTGNLGNADLTAALRWIHDNIAVFGGDPDNVTLFGQSGGGMKVLTLMQTPEANTLFQKGIVQSGVIANMFNQDKKVNHAFVEKLRERGIADKETLETMPYRRLVEEYQKIEEELTSEGYEVTRCPVENAYYLGNPLEHGFCERAKEIPLLVGSVFGEFDFDHGINGKEDYSEEAIRQMLEAQLGDGAEALSELFKETYPDKHILDLLSLDNFIRSTEIDLIKERCKSDKSDTYSFLFTYNFALDGGKTAWHCCEIPFVFHNIEKVPVCNDSEETKILEKQMSFAWAQFARTGKPELGVPSPGETKVPQWTACAPGKENVMVFDRTCQVRTNFDHELIALHEQYFDGSSRLKADNVQH